MRSYLERYLDGEHVGVWAELAALGPAVREEPVFRDAQAVAQEMMVRAKHNVGLLVERLAALEYRFIDPDSVWTPPDASDTTALDTLDALLIDGDDYWMGTMFVPYLRACFEWGGFPGLRTLDEADRPKEELGFLTEGLLAL